MFLLVSSPQSIVMIIIAPIGGWLSDKYGPRHPTVGGMALATVGLGGMALLQSSSVYWEIVVVQAVFGAGMGFFTSPNNVTVLEAVPVEKTGLTGSLLATIRNFGRVSGVALAVLLLGTQVGTRAAYPVTAFLRGTHVVFLGGVLLGVLATLLALRRQIS